jgi:5-formyltetrahydrofolate cyclo-ligase
MKPELPATKSAFRQHFRRLMQSLPPGEATRLSEKICENFFAETDLSAINMLHIFLPLQKNNEINTWLIINRLWQEFPWMQVVVPMADFEAMTLKNIHLKVDSELVENRFGIPEPKTGMEIAAQAVDLVVLPLLTFDESGNRLGYGKGFYDRFLKNCRAEVPKVGLSYFPPVPQLPIQAWDVALNVCVTPEKVYSFL